MHRTSAPVVLRRVVTMAAGLAVAGSMALVAAAPVAAASLVVTDPLDQELANGECSLREALAAANADTANADCPAGSGADTITFDPAVTSITLGSTLELTSDVTIGGPNTVLLSGNDTFRLIHVSAGTATLRQLALADGGTAENGGAILNEATLTLDRVTISSSAAGGQGGAVANTASLTVTGGSMSTNTAQNGGGAIVNGAPASTLTVTGTLFSDNQSNGSGGAIVAGDGDVTITRSTFTGNSATSYGGAVVCECVSFSLVDSTVSGNTAARGGGVAVAAPAISTIRGSTINGNGATADGGGVAALGDLTVVNSTIWSNTAAGKGGAIWRDHALTLVHATIAKNVANGGANSGGGLFSNDGAPAGVVRNTVIAGNANGNIAAAIGVPGVIGTNSISVIPAGKTIDDLLDPLGLQSNGGPTKTVKPTNATGNPLLGAGDVTVCTTAPASSRDQRGYGRYDPCDIGAVELDRTKPVVSGVKLSLREGVAISTSPRARLTWKTVERESGVKSFRVDRSVNGGAWTTVVSSQSATYLDVSLASGASYRYRVRAVDREGNVGVLVSGSTVTSRLVQQTSGSFTYAGSWTSSTSSSFSGGSARYAKAAGARTVFTATGRSFAFISTRGPGRGAARIYVDGVLDRTVDLHTTTPSSTYRVQVWTRTFSGSATHTVKVVVVGTPGHPRVDADAFAVLR